MIDAIDDASRRGDLETALDLALDRWRASRDPLLADLIDALGDALPSASIDRRTFHRAWLELARANRASDVGTLVAGLRTMLPRPQRTNAYTTTTIPAGWIERIAVLATRGDDPRFGRALLGAMRDTPWDVYASAGDPGREAYAAPFRLLARLRDVRLIPALEELAVAARERRLRHMWYLVDELVGPVLDELRAVRPEEAVDRARCRAIIARHQRTEPRVDAARVHELFAMVYADPDDAAARHVLADALQELGDPRGELIALQLASDAHDPAHRERVESLLRKHRGEWLGDLDHVLKLVVFERGFLASAALVANARAEEVVWERAPHDERLATVEQLAKGNGNERHYSAFVFSPQMRSLRTVELLSGRMVTRTCDAAEPWSFEHLVFDKQPTGKQIAQLAATSALPHWSRLTFASASRDVDALVALVQPVAARLVEIHLDVVGATSATQRSWLAAVDRLPTAVATELVSAQIRAARHEGALVVEIELGSWAVRYLEDFVVRFREIAPPMDRLTVSAPPGADHAAIAAALAAFPVAAVHAGR